MFLSYAVVPVMVFTVLLNFFYLYAPIDSKMCGQNFTTCQECLDSPCHKDTKRPCTINSDKCTFACFTCDPDADGAVQYYCEPECTTACAPEAPAKKCVCNGACWSCMAADSPDIANFICAMPTQMMDDTCAAVPYGPPTSGP